MATKNELFSKCITEAMSAANGIAAPLDKANAYSNIAKALAMTMGGTKTTDAVADVAVQTNETNDKQAINPETAKENSKVKDNKAGKLSAPKKEEVKEEPVVSTDDSDEEEWTERMQEKYAPEMKKFEEFLEAYGEDNIKQCVEAFTESQYHEITDITPLNISAFIFYLEGLAANQ